MMVQAASGRGQTTREVYLQRADEAREEAAAATLANVRERCLRAEAAWAMMAARVERAEAMRAELEAEKFHRQQAIAELAE